jgi:hypothetical protein
MLGGMGRERLVERRLGAAAIGRARHDGEAAAPAVVAGAPAAPRGGLVADAAFVDGSHRFHEVFVDLYFLRKLVRPGGLVVLDDHWWPSVAAAARYFERDLGWQVVPGAFGGDRLRGLRLPDQPFEPSFERFKPF